MSLVFELSWENYTHFLLKVAKHMHNCTAHDSFMYRTGDLQYYWIGTDEVLPII